MEVVSERAPTDRDSGPRESGELVTGDVIRVSPAWTDSVFSVTLALFIVATAVLIFGRVTEYAAGRAIVRLHGQIDVTTLAAGAVEAVEVLPGQPVNAGQVLFRLTRTQEKADLARAQEALERQLATSLRDITDPKVQTSISTLRAARDQAAFQYEARVVRAPQAGVVTNLRVHPGMTIAAGELVCSLIGTNSFFSVVAMLPGRYRPKLTPGMSMRIEVEGYPRAYQTVYIDRISNEVIGPTEVKRFLGPEIGDALQITEPVVLVEARLPTNTFEAEGNTLRYHHGLGAQAYARLSGRPIWKVILPNFGTPSPTGGGGGGGAGSGGGS
jgi:membrane fusion protein (multidrug efflux system)